MRKKQPHGDKMLDIKIKNKRYKETEILKDIKLHIKDAEFISIIGASGCGKTSLLRMISSLDEDYDGKISYKNGKTIDNLGYIFQDSRLLPWLNVMDNILLVSKNKDEEYVHKLLDEVGLIEYKYAYIKELSGGMKRRVSIVRAFVNNPEVLLLDEPFISLDYPTAKSLRELLFKLYKEFSPIVIFVTHDLSEALCLSNRIIFLNSKPASIIYEYENIPSFDEKSINIKKEEILEQYPEILSGKV